MAPNNEKKQLQGQARRMSSELRGLALAHAYSKVTRSGFRLRVDRLDGNKRAPAQDEDPLRLNVDVFDGIVRTAWTG